MSFRKIRLTDKFRAEGSGIGDFNRDVPTRAQLATVGNWSKVYETKNIGIVRATITSNFD